MFNVVIHYPDGSTSILSVRNRVYWSKRTAQRHAADIRKGRTGVTGFSHVAVREH